MFLRVENPYDYLHPSFFVKIVLNYIKYERKQGNLTQELFVGLTFLRFETFCAILGHGQKVPILWNQISTIYLIILITKFATQNYVFMLHLKQNPRREVCISLQKK